MRIAAALLALTVTASAQDDTPSEIERYCTAITDPARETRYALAEERLVSLRRTIEARRVDLSERTAELRDWVSRRETFLALADDRLVQIYGAMRPDTAGEQLALIDPVVGAALVMRLKPRQASGVLAAMPTEKAAELVSLISASSERLK